MNKDDLDKVVELHGKWLHNEAGGAHANLRGANLRGANLCGANLCGVSLRGADLCGANLRGASLRGADLCGASLRGADLCGANLRGANLCGVSLRGADLCGASLRGANLCGANLCGANLNNCSGNRAEIKSIFVSGVYSITYTDKYLQIGCQRHDIEEWWGFDESEIKEMDGQSAICFWTEWKDIIRTIIEKSPAKSGER